MKVFFSSSLIVLITALFYNCSSSSDEIKDTSITTLKGSWQLDSYIPHVTGGGPWTQYGDSIIYQKHLTDSHFMWFNYNKNQERIIGMGGGSYLFDPEDSIYIENIVFFYPPGSSELGQSIKFDVQVKDGVWYHTGEAMITEMDPTGDKLLVVDSNKIEEKWVPINAPVSQNLDLMGSWDLIAYRDSLDGDYMDYPDFVGYMKLITPTHFTWFYFDHDGDDIYASGSGTYSFDGKVYIEKIDMVYPDNTGILNETLKFKAEIQNNQWKHFGYIPVVAIDSTTGQIKRDSALIDELWQQHTGSDYDLIVY